MTGLTLDNIPHAANSSVSNESCNEQSDHSSEDKTLVEEDGEAAQSRRKRLAMFGPVSGSRNMQLFESLPRRNEFLLSGYTPPTPKPVNRVLSTTGFNHVSMDINESDNKCVYCKQSNVQDFLGSCQSFQDAKTEETFWAHWKCMIWTTETLEDDNGRIKNVRLMNRLQSLKQTWIPSMPPIIWGPHMSETTSSPLYLDHIA